MPDDEEISVKECLAGQLRCYADLKIFRPHAFSRKRRVQVTQPCPLCGAWEMRMRDGEGYLWLECEPCTACSPCYEMGTANGKEPTQQAALLWDAWSLKVQNERRTISKRMSRKKSAAVKDGRQQGCSPDLAMPEVQLLEHKTNHGEK